MRDVWLTGWSAEARDPAMMALVRESSGSVDCVLPPPRGGLRGGRDGVVLDGLMIGGEDRGFGVVGREAALAGGGLVWRPRGGVGGLGVWVDEAETKLSFEDSETAVVGRLTAGGGVSQSDSAA